MLEAHSGGIASELEDLILSGRLRLHPHSPGGSRKPLTNGDWNMFELWSLRRPHIANLIEAPLTAGVLSSMPDVTGCTRGVAYFSVLQPGVRVASHCGPTNTRIRVQLGLTVPAGATMRVGTETRGWDEGKCLVFDDSWEHEAANPSDRPRSILIVDVWHPDLSAEQRSAVDSGQAVTAATPSDRAWARRENERSNDARDPDPIDPAIFAALNPNRIARITATTRQAHELGAQGVADAARRVLRALTSDGDQGGSADQRSATQIPDDLMWAELERIAIDAPEHGLEPSDLVGLALVCSIAWRAWPGRADAMADFLEVWPAADKGACADELVALGTVSRMISVLAARTVHGSRPPFGALVPILCAAHRRSLSAR